MPVALIGADGVSSDRRVFTSAIGVGTGVLVVMVAQIVELLDPGNHFISLIGIGGAIAAFVALVMGAPLALREMGRRREDAGRALKARRQVEQLFRMTDMLQSALDYGDANAVLRATAAQLMPEFGGALYVFNNSRDRMDLSVQWGWPEDAQPPESISPSQCWALKRGKSHINEVGPHALRCEHQADDLLILEIPMMARGEVYGLLNVLAAGDDAEQQIGEVTALAGAIADAMSLALSNIALREKLRTQALRDPLTGLYNRRYMEDVLERYANLAERNGSSLSAIMIDLDQFKRLNDEHGHAVGDAVLRAVASSIVGAIRPSDVACRYGGEELVVLLPDCSLGEAVGKAELLRGRIESLSDIHGTRITASLGVATMPETATNMTEILPSADAALYRAKQAGRNRAEAAVRRPEGGSGHQLADAAE
jgi:diguanylate cyclase (GGDEF)-like protein